MIKRILKEESERLLWSSFPIFEAFYCRKKNKFSEQIHFNSFIKLYDSNWSTQKWTPKFRLFVWKQCSANETFKVCLPWEIEMQILRSIAIYPAIGTQQLRRKMSISNLGVSFVSYFELSYVEAQCLLKKHIFSLFRIWASPRWKINIFVLSFRNRSIVCRAKGRVVSTGAKFLRFQCITSFVVTEPILEPRFPQENQVKVVLVVLLWKWSSIFRMMLVSLSEARPGFAIKGACPGALHKLPVTKSNAYIFTKMTRNYPVVLLPVSIVSWNLVQ